MMDQLEEDLRNVVLAEPPLGIDPDRVADLAARKQRMRKAGMSTGIGVLAVAGITAGAVAFTSGASPGPDTSRIPVADPIGINEPVEPGERNVEHLRAVLATLLPQAHGVQVAATWDRGKGRPQLTAEVAFTDAAGPAQFRVTVSNVAGTLPPRAEMCVAASPEAAGVPGYGVVRCDKTQRPGGDTLVVVETGRTQQTYRRFLDYRTGNHTVSVDDEGRGPDHGSHGHALTEQQAIALATDPAFALP